MREKPEYIRGFYKKVSPVYFEKGYVLWRKRVNFNKKNMYTGVGICRLLFVSYAMVSVLTASGRMSFPSRRSCAAKPTSPSME